ncbi:WG repeat-containing protein [Alysiella crassa]|uniref:KWG Leptospira n=1 Tax=Alysiella crassa TaxID=153491 RepID=A0A376BMH0_9NEIS|nr:WG repeat-containing protein [Alysiella crassa]UOP07010.1 WG repeat-containing protein [Alysiella crassa]SSY70848.1 Uncharacterised protein [Alysiella crassa]
MKFVKLLILLFALNHAHSAELHYFVDKNSGLVGVKNRAGKIIIPAKHRFAELWGRYQRPIANHQYEIEFLGRPDNLPEPSSPAVSIAGSVYNRDGKFLYHAQWFDNGLDLWSEGKRRFVENGKIGFVNRDGEKIIAAQYDNAGQFQLGYANVIIGKVNKQCIAPDDCEKFLYVANEGADEFVINERGERISGSLKPEADSDIQIGHLYYPMPLKVENALENKIMANITRFKTQLDDGEENLFYAISARPSAHFPYYEISQYRIYQPHHAFPNTHWEVKLVADRLGNLYHFDNGFEDEKRVLKPVK